MTNAARIGLLGGTFDPIHVGHLSAAVVARDALALDCVLLVQSHVPPHRPQPVASVPHRFGMLSLAVDGHEGLLASDLELSSPGPSYTSATLHRLHGVGYHAWQLFFITGADAFAEIATWRDFPSFLDDAHFVVVNRGGRAATTARESVPALAARMIDAAPGAHLPPEPGGATRIFLVDAPTPDVSSTTIRGRCAEGASIAGLVPESVVRHIHRHGLYRGRVSGSDVAAAPGAAASQLHEQESH